MSFPGRSLKWFESETDCQERLTSHNASPSRAQFPIFRGSSDPDEFIEWIAQCESRFEKRSYSAQEEARLAISGFREAAQIWWTGSVQPWTRKRRTPPSTWTELMRAMRARFVPESFQAELMRRLRTLRQGNHTVAKYYRQMRLLMLQTGVEEG